MSGFPQIKINPHNIKYSHLGMRKHSNAEEKIFCDLCGKEIPLGENMYILITETGNAYISCKKPEGEER